VCVDWFGRQKNKPFQVAKYTDAFVTQPVILTMENFQKEKEKTSRLEQLPHHSQNIYARVCLHSFVISRNKRRNFPL
jgi:hypothetical protein